MRKIGLFITGLALSCSSLIAQIKQERNVSDYYKLKASSAIKVVLTIGERESVVFEAEEEVMPKLKAEVTNGELRLYASGNTNNKKPMIAYVTAKKINSIDASGAANVNVATLLTSEQMKLTASGAANITLELNANEVVADVAGAGNIRVQGSSQVLKATATGAGTLKANELKANDVTVSASGSGYAAVNAGSTLKADASGAGSVRYYSEPKDKKISVTTAGSVTKA